MANHGGETAEARAAKIIREIIEGEVINSRILAESEDGRWDHLTPKMILVAAIQIVLRNRWDNGLSTVGQAAPRFVESVPAGDVLSMTEMFLGGVSGPSDERHFRYFTFPNVVKFLSALLGEESVSQESADDLLSAAVEACRESLQGDVIRRGAESGPWDIEEIDVSDLDLIDMGGIRVPVSAGMAVRPIEVDGEILAVTLVQGDTALQLQAFRANSSASWDAVRADMILGIRAQGGEVKEWTDRAGVEIRASVPRVTESGQSVTRDIRVLGSDGPGWMLRAIVSGDGAVSGSGNVWAYETFLATVVVSGYASSRMGNVIRLCSPVG
ncbi:DUF3710 domain-containing protein [Streptomyces sp. NBC_01591]|uniref:DUF3710 domain-containing protein n=1 Tax=Streptomyces sp. NBC_01591 TaxID=2975888 RepID=UPI002DDC5372|nr:DUF3710 domain-containing protein [Streptomyces sp. NBC_01591]WSD68973.1 DUF3710 domain-containing protein [Streptomyces sp. NBC_01591]